MGFFDGIGNTFKGMTDGMLGGLGGKSSYDQKQANANVGEYNDTLIAGENRYNDSLGALGQQSNQLAGQNYFGNAQDIYGQQRQASQMLYNQATGAAPSAADIQMQSGLGNANNQVQSAAFSQQGGVSPGLTQRNLLNAQAMQNANIVAAGQANRANELNNAQQNYSALLGSMQGQQQNLGQMQYQQGQNNLNYLTNNANNINQNTNTNAANLLGQQQGVLNTASGAKQQQYQAMSNTMAAAATGGASLMIPKGAPK